MNKKTLFLFQLILIFAAYSCSISGSTSQPTVEVNSLDEIPSDFELWAQGKLPLIQLTSGQDGLTNFREFFSIRLSGEDPNGKPFTGSQEYLIEQDRAADKSHELETLQTPSRYLSGTREWVVADGFTYLVQDTSQGGRNCQQTENPADPSHYADVHVTRILQAISPGERLENNVRVNDIPAEVYEIENATFLFVRELTNITGQVWIAQQPAYFLRAEGVMEGVFEFENIHYTGQATFSYELKDFNQVQVQIPTLCTHPPTALIPMPANAQEVQDYPEMITFLSPDPVEQVLSFYLSEFPAQGWEMDTPQSTQFEQVVTARLTSPQSIQISVEVTIVAMSFGSRVQIGWLAH